MNNANNPDGLQKKRPRKPKKENIIRDAKVHGKEHVNHVGKLISRRITGNDCRCSRFKCFSKVAVQKRQNILEEFNNMSTKDQQDAHLCGLISLRLVGRRRPRKDDENTRKDHSAAYSYKLRIDGKDVAVCQKAFLSVHGISKNRLSRLQQSLVTRGVSPRSKQGHHSCRPRSLPKCLKVLIEDHIKSYQARKSHYSIRDNPNRRYLPEDLTVADMHKHFRELYQLNIRYKSNWLVFKTFNIRFGYPKSDTCAICDSLQQKINEATDEEKIRFATEKEIHLRKAQAFRKEKKKFTLKAKEGKINCLTFDFMQNLPLPHIPSGPVFYSRQLWYNVFRVHDLGDDSVKIYRYLESEGKKEPNEVTSMLLDAINNIPHDKRREELVLISDGFPGQNKNKTMVQFVYCLVHILKLFHKIIYIFPMRGHSYIPNDQDFALIGHKKKKTVKAEIPEIWDNMIRHARQYPSKFDLKIMNHFDFFAMKQAVEPFFLQLPKPPLKLQEVRMIMIDRSDRHVNLRKSYYGSWERHITVNKSFHNNFTTLNMCKIYDVPPGIQPAKEKDLRQLLQYLENPIHRQYYERLLMKLPSATEDAPTEDNLEIDNDDNSDNCVDA